jgi:type IV pilus assembly protein PilC
MSATFTYKVRDKSGKIQSGEIEGQSSAAVVKALRAKGLTPIKVDEKSSSGLQAEIRIPGLSDRIKTKELSIFSRQFATMVNSGLSLIRALTILVDQTENRALAEVIGKVRGDVEQGISLSAAMEKHSKVFSKLYVSMIRAGEVGGVLDETLDRLADIVEAQVALRSKVKSAMAYPVVVFGLVIVITAAMIVFVVPMFEGLYSEVGDGSAQLPAPTRMLIGMSSILTGFWFIVFPLPVVAFIMFRRWITTDEGRFRWDTVKLKLPVFGKLAHKTAISRFSETLGVLGRSGVPILQALDIVADTSGNAVLSRAILDVKASVREGESIAGPLTRHKVFPPMVVQMMAVGEETGALDTMLKKVSDFYRREVNDTVDALTSLLEPLLIIVMGVTVGGILIALYLPIFNLASSL